jgi:hypothetical protein
MNINNKKEFFMFSAICLKIESYACDSVLKMIFGSAYNPVASLPDETMIEIFFKNAPNLHASACVSRRFNALSKTPEACRPVLEACRFALNMSPSIFALAADPLSLVSNLQVTVYEQLVSELKGLGLDSSFIKKNDLASYGEANRLIEAKNFCLFCSALPGFTVNTEKLQTLDQIYAQEKTCRSYFENSFDPQQVILINTGEKSLTRLPEEIGLFKALERLYLQSKELHFLPDSIGNLQNLKTFAFSPQKLFAIPDSIHNLQKLNNPFLL